MGYRRLLCSLALGLLALSLSACSAPTRMPCNTSGKPIQVTAATAKSVYWGRGNYNNSWLVLIQEGNTMKYCRGDVNPDIKIEPGKFYYLRGFNQDTDI